MITFYWVVAMLIIGTLVPSEFFLLLYAVQVDQGHAIRARSLWNFSKLFAMLGINILIWGHAAAGPWNIWMR